MTNTKDEGNPKLECRTTLRGALGGFVTRMGIGVLYLREGEAPSPAATMPACVQRSGRHLACRRAGHPARQNERVGAHLIRFPELCTTERGEPVPARSGRLCITRRRRKLCRGNNWPRRGHRQAHLTLRASWQEL